MKQKSVLFKDGEVKYTILINYENGEITEFLFKPEVSRLTLEGLISLGDTLQNAIVDIDSEFSENKELKSENSDLGNSEESVISENGLTKDQAIEAMKKGEKVTHTSFAPGEFRSIVGDKIVIQDGTEIDLVEYFSHERNEAWEFGWSVFKDQDQ